MKEKKNEKNGEKMTTWTPPKPGTKIKIVDEKEKFIAPKEKPKK